MWKQAWVLLCLAVLAVLPSTATAAESAAQRKDGFKEAKRKSAALKDAIERGDGVSAAKFANDLAAFAEQLPELFPPESKGGFFSAAKDKIWTQFPNFVAKSKDFELAAKDLGRLAAAAPAEKGAWVDGYRRLSNTCAACHRDYKRGL